MLWVKKSNMNIDNFFSKNGKMFKDMELKDKLDTLSFDEKIDLLSSDGRLVKRPIVIGEDFVVVGFKESDYKSKVK